MKEWKKFKGCLLGGAIGDALGYSVECLPAELVYKKYYDSGITELELFKRKARISDDTQMTLFTANGLLTAQTMYEFNVDIRKYLLCIIRCYKDWVATQTSSFPVKSNCYSSWLLNNPGFFVRRRPENTCLRGMSSDMNYDIYDRVNNSKACGGLIRVAPIGLFFSDNVLPEKIDMLGANVAALTHGHELGFIPAAALVHIINLIAHNSNISLYDAIIDMKDAVVREFSDFDYIKDFIDIVDLAITLSNTELNTSEAIAKIGGGWVAEETLAIALYSSLKFSDDFEKAVIASVNHSGNSGSTGSVTGNIMGAYLGFDAISKKFTEHLELKNVIYEITYDLYRASHIDIQTLKRDHLWKQKYVNCSFHMD